MKLITQEETDSYIKIERNDPYTCAKAVAYTLTPSQEQEYQGWEDITYYSQKTKNT